MENFLVDFVYKKVLILNQYLLKLFEIIAGVHFAPQCRIGKTVQVND